jgi:uroporphyrinogen-III synthase
MVDGPLAGRRILLTRPADRSAALSAILSDWGAEVEVQPTIELLPPLDDGPTRAALARLAEFDWLVFTSVNGIRFFRAALAATAAAPALPGQVAVVGPASASAASEAGLPPTLVAAAGDAEGLAAELAPRLGSDNRLLLVGPEAPRPQLAERLRTTGAQVEQVAFYRNAPAPGVPAAVASIRDDRYDVVVLASPSALERLFGATGTQSEALREALERSRIVTIGNVTAGAVEARGLVPAAVAERPTDEALAEAIRRLFD